MAFKNSGPRLSSFSGFVSWFSSLPLLFFFFFKQVEEPAQSMCPKGKDARKQKSFDKDFTLCLGWHEEAPGGHSPAQAPAFRPGGGSRGLAALGKGGMKGEG